MCSLPPLVVLSAARLAFAQSVVAYDAWLQSPDGPDVLTSPILAALRDYNRDDCESTRQLADWLWALRARVFGEGVMVGDAHRDTQDIASKHALQEEAKEGGESKEGSESEGGEHSTSKAAEVEAKLAWLDKTLADDAWAAGTVLSDGAVRTVLRGLLRYHKREAKPGWWRR